MWLWVSSSDLNKKVALSVLFKSVLWDEYNVSGDDLWWGATAQNSSLALVRCQVINRRVFLCGLCQGSEYHPRHQEHLRHQGHRQDQDHRTFTSFRQSTTFMIIFIVQNGIQHSFLNWLVSSLRNMWAESVVLVRHPLSSCHCLFCARIELSSGYFYVCIAYTRISPSTVVRLSRFLDVLHWG